MAKAFEESHQAYASGDGALAKELSNKGKQHKAEMERLNRAASEWIFVGACVLSAFVCGRAGLMRWVGRE